jgi:hypothetical protein
VLGLDQTQYDRAEQVGTKRVTVLLMLDLPSKAQGIACSKRLGALKRLKVVMDLVFASLAMHASTSYRRSSRSSFLTSFSTQPGSES